MSIKLATKASAAAIAVAGVISTSAVMAPLAVADTPGCVTRAEFRAVHKGWMISRVRTKFDTAGKQLWFIGGTQFTPAEQGREYRACNHPSYSTVEVDYTKKAGVWRVDDKFAYWG